MNQSLPREKRPPFSTPFFYGWIIVAVSALTLFFSGPGQTYSVSTFIDSYISEFGWSRSLVSGMYSIGTLTAGLTMGVMGNLFDRRGHRVMTTVVAVCLGLACFWMSVVSDSTMLLAGFLMIRLLGQGSMSLSSSTLPPQWFITRKGFALSLASVGGVMSSAFLPPLNTWIIQNYGWQMGWRTWAFLLFAVMAPLAYIIIRDRPEDVGLWPDDVERSWTSTDSAGITVEDDPWTVREAMGTRSFWLLLFCRMIPSAIVTGLVFHQASVMAEVGLPVEAAAMVLSAMALVRLPVVLVAGQVADRVPTRFLIAGAQGGLLVGMAVLLLASSVEASLVYGAIIGIAMSFEIIAGGIIWPAYYGRHHLSSIRGVSMMAGVIGSALGPLPYGFAYDLLGSYNQAITISMVFPLLGMVAAMMAVRPVK
ncbi:MAG: MFS transporter [Candidatus Bathyarchaeota archaeon]|nr:MAG: MFS transporter [Candidatus Bathyarchaeota archaeon]